MKSFQAQTHYEVLEVSVGASADEIRAAYERLTRLYGDEQLARYGLVDPARAQMLRERMRAALDVLLDEPRRDAYDASIGLPPRAAAAMPAPATAAKAVVSTGGWGAGVAWVTPAPSAPRAEPSGQVFAVAIRAPPLGASTAMAPPPIASAQQVQAGPRAEAPLPEGTGPALGQAPAAAPADGESRPASSAGEERGARAAAEVETGSTAQRDVAGASKEAGASSAEAAEAPRADPAKPAALVASELRTQEAPVRASEAAPVSAPDTPAPGGAPVDPPIAPGAQVQDARGSALAPEGTGPSGTPGLGEPPSAEAPSLAQAVAAARAEAAPGAAAAVTTEESAPPEPPQTVPAPGAPAAAVTAEPAPVPADPPKSLDLTEVVSAAAPEPAESVARAEAAPVPAAATTEAPRSPEPTQTQPVAVIPPAAAGAVAQVGSASIATHAQSASASEGAGPTPVPAAGPEPYASVTGAASAEAQDVPRLSDDAEVAIVPARATPREYRAEPRPRPYEVPAGVEINGDLLKQVRMARGLTLAQLSERTRISVRHLENVESDRYELLPAPVYLRGILMNLARELGLDGLRVSKSYLAFVEAHRAKG